MTLEDNLAGIFISAEKVEETNTETIIFRKIMASHRIYCSQ